MSRRRCFGSGWVVVVVMVVMVVMPSSSPCYSSSLPEPLRAALW